MSTVFTKIACSIGKRAKEYRPEFRPGPLPLRFAELLHKLAEKECSERDVEKTPRAKEKYGESGRWRVELRPGNLDRRRSQRPGPKHA